MKTLLAALPLLVLLVGCSTTGPNSISPLIVRLGVSTTVTYGVAKYPQSVPGVRVAGEVICSAAASTNISPANLIAAIQGASTNITPETALIVNGALVLYIGIWNSYGQNAVSNYPALKQYLQATCDGINDGLATRRPTLSSRAREKAAQEQWPLLRSE